MLFLTFAMSGGFCYSNNINFGGTIGISLTLGTKVNRAGIMAGGFIYYQNLQINSYWNGFYALNSFGPNLKRLESQTNIGLLAAYGPAFDYYSEQNRQFFSPVSNHTGRKHSISYIYKIYHDNINTSQSTGIVGFSVGRTAAFMENDLFIFKGSDRYRTGAFSVMHQVENFQAGLTALLWTGNTQAEGSIRVKPGETDYPSRHGYYDLSKAKYGRYAHGILAFNAAVQMPYRQTIGARLGIDAEQVRHIIQNRILHDLPFIPLKLNKSVNPHFPMLSPEGEPYIFKEGQQVRNPKLFGDVSLNPSLFY